MITLKGIQLPDKRAIAIVVVGIATVLLILLPLLLVPSRAGAQNMTFSLVEPFPELIVSAGGSTADWGDYDGDGDLDLVVAGYAPDVFATYLFKIYRNDGASGFSDIGRSLADAKYSAVWGDYDGDGDLDVLVKTQFSVAILRNDGFDTFVHISVIASCFTGNLALWRDLDGDGDLDIVDGGCGMLRNDAGVYTNVAAFTSARTFSIADHDGDGDQDIVSVGTTGANGTKVYRNDGSFVFTNIGANIIGVSGDVKWFDYDNDGDRDIVLCGNTGSGKTTKIYTNSSGVFADSGAVFEGIDNCAVSTVDFDGDADHDILVTGNGTSTLVSKYYRNDGAGVFTDVSLGLPGAYSPIMSWADYDGDGDADLYLSGLTASTVVAALYRNDGGAALTNSHPPVIQGTYEGGVECGDYNSDGHDDLYVYGDPGSFTPHGMLYRNVGDGGFVSSGVSVAQVQAGDVAWGDYDGDGDLDYAVCGDTPGSRIYRNNGNSTFTDIGAGLQAVNYCSVDWGDYDGDGDLDLALTGQSGGMTSLIYRNNGNGTFSNISAAITGVAYGNTDWGDYDGDGDLDLLIIGYNDSYNSVAKVYRNDSGTFVDSGIVLSGTSSQFSTATWVDYDGDGDLDISRGSLLYRNTEGSFSPSSGIGDIKSYWGDADGDGDVDALTSSYIWRDTRVYTNTGSGTFAQVHSGLAGRYSGATWCDIDNDGDLDYTVVGQATSSFDSAAIHVYRNNTFPKLTGHVTLSGQALAGVAMLKAGIQLATADGTGEYNAIGIAKGSPYQLIPSLAGYTFTPASVTGVLNATATHDFAATLNTYTISGVVTSGGNPLGNVSIDGGALGNATTDSGGNYSFAGVDHGTSYTLTPSLAGYTFSPLNVSSSLTAAATHNFAGTLTTHSITGVVTAGGSPLAGVSVDGGALGSVTTDTNGAYSFTGVSYGTNYTLSPSLSNYTFLPSTVSGTVSGDLVADFTGTYLPPSTVTSSSTVILSTSTSSAVSTTTPGSTSISTSIDIVTSVLPTTTIDSQSTTTTLPPATTTSGITTTAITTTVLADSDNDGVTDEEELSQGTNPLDGGSRRPKLRTVLCSEWNGYLGGMYNILEHLNLSSKKLRVKTELRSIRGHLMDTYEFFLRGNQQFDLLVHDMDGHVQDSYGQVCSTYEGAPAGSVDGRMVYYRFGATGDIQFAFALPFETPLRGQAFLLHNTHQPSLIPSDSDDFVANWIQLSNVSSKRLKGKLYFYDLGGKLLGTSSVNLRDGARYDYSAHAWGSNSGLVRFAPDSDLDSDDVDYQLRGVRYFYDNAQGTDSFTTAYPFLAAMGNGEIQVAPVDLRSGNTAVLEMANTLARDVKVSVKLYTRLGKVIYSKVHRLKPYASQHIELAPVYKQSREGKVRVATDDNLGLAVVKGDRKESVLAAVVHYGRNIDGGIENMFAVALEEPVPATVRGSYNTYLSQGCELYLANAATAKEQVIISATDRDGKASIQPYTVFVAGRGVLVENLCSKVAANDYGIINVTASKPKAISGTIVRKGDGARYKIATALR